MTRRVVVLGGGLAGLVTAKALARAEISVELWEATDRFGGKAGSVAVPAGDRLADHGFHIFPKWYRNTNALLAELGIVLREGPDFFEVQPQRLRRPGDPPFKPIAFRLPSRTTLASLDLVSRPDWYLDEFSLDGFLRSRIYAGRSSGDRLREISRKALASPAYRCSALTMQRNLRWWMPVIKKPNWNALQGPMQTTFIDPLVTSIDRAHAKLVLNRPVTRLVLDGRRVVALHAGDEQVAIDAETDVVSTLPVEVLQRLLHDDPTLYRHLDSLGSPLAQLPLLETAPLSALDLHLTRRIDGFPPGHFLLRHSRYELSGLDITSMWPEYGDDHPTVLQLIAGEPTAILGMAAPDFTRAIVDDLSRYFPIRLADVDYDRTVAMAHVDEPLFMNNVGSNSRRIDPTDTGVENLFVAGDHANTKVDLASMEGAVFSALNVARAIAAKDGRQVPGALPLHGVPRWFVRTWKVARYPVGLLAWPLRLTDMHYWGRAFREWVKLRGP